MIILDLLFEGRWKLPSDRRPYTSQRCEDIKRLINEIAHIIQRDESFIANSIANLRFSRLICCKLNDLP